MTGSVVRRPSSPVRPLQLNCCRTDQQVLHRDGLMDLVDVPRGLVPMLGAAEDHLQAAPGTVGAAWGAGDGRWSTGSAEGGTSNPINGSSCTSRCQFGTAR